MRSVLAWCLAFVVFVGSLAAGVQIYQYVEESAATYSCENAGSGSGGDVITSSKDVSLSRKGLTVKGAPMNEAQAKVVTQIGGVVVARRNDFPQRFFQKVTKTLLTAGTVESELTNLPYGDRDSKGVFQERPSQGWGTAEQVQNVEYATSKMLDALLAVPNWKTMPIGDLAQAMERSGYPDRYALWVSEATRTFNQIKFGDQSEDPASTAAVVNASLSENPPIDTSCADEQTDSNLVERAISIILTQEGQPYVFGDEEPGGFDCSGLLYWGFGKVGVKLPRIAADQWNYKGDPAKGITTKHVPREQLKRGDFVFWSNNGSPSGIFHVGLYMGNGKLFNAANPRTDVLMQNMYYDRGFIGGLRISVAASSSSGSSETGGAWALPMKRGTYTNTGSGGQYGPRIHPVTHKPGFHNGVDLGAPVGTPLQAVHSGKVVARGYDSCWGNYVAIEGGGVIVLYPHQSSIAGGMNVGDSVSLLQRVGSVGESGCVTGAHLHLSVCTDLQLCLKGSGARGRGSVNPNSFFASKGLPLFKGQTALAA